MTVLAVTSEGSGICRGSEVVVPARATSTLEPANFSREDLKAVRTPPLMLALITSIQASTAFRLWSVATSLAMASFVGGCLLTLVDEPIGANGLFAVLIDC